MQQQPPCFLGLALKHLGEQVVGHRSLATGELGNEPLGVRIADQRQRGQPQPCRPAFRPLVQSGEALVGEQDSGAGEEFSRLLGHEAEIRAADLRQLAGDAQPMQPEPWVAPGRQHDA